MRTLRVFTCFCCVFVKKYYKGECSCGMLVLVMIDGKDEVMDFLKNSVIDEE